jgi:hypothetical protein
VYFNPDFGASILPLNVATFTRIFVVAAMKTDLPISEILNYVTTVTNVGIRQSGRQNSSCVSPQDVSYIKIVHCDFRLLRNWNGIFL